MKRQPDSGVQKKSSRLFTGASWASRGFELFVLVAGIALAARAIAVAPAGDSALPFHGLAGDMAAVLALAVIALAGAFPLPLGNKTYLSLGSGAAFAVLLVFSPREALPLAVAGTLIAQILRQRRGYRLTFYTILFNEGQYLVTWSLCLALYFRAQADLMAHPALSALPMVVAGIFYVLVNTWLVAVWNALRKRTAAWDLWVRTLHEIAPGYAVALVVGTTAAVLARTHAVWDFPLILGLVGAHWGLARMSRIRLRQNSVFLAAMVEFAECLSPYTMEHSERVAWWAERLARRMDIPEDEVEVVAIAGKVHDLAKTLLRPLEEKPGPLTQEEWALMRQHPVNGAAVVARLPGMETVASYVRHHHEHYNGAGYPDGLSREAIPLGARIIAVADSFDAMLEHRTYRRALLPEEALAEIIACAGTQFDPQVVGVLEALMAEPAGTRGTVMPFPLPTPALATVGAGGTLPAAGVASAWPASHHLMATVGARRSQSQKVQRPLTELNEHIRDQALDAPPAILYDLGLLPALLWYIDRYQARTGVRVEFEHGGLVRRMRREIETAAYRIVQEALTNVARHAEVSEVWARVWAGESTLDVQVSDGGKGFDQADPEIARSHHGLAGMHERAAQVGGRLWIASVPGKGTLMAVKLPFQTEKVIDSTEKVVDSGDSTGTTRVSH